MGFFLTINVSMLQFVKGDDMLECLIIGDSIAVGTAMARPECVSYSKGGWNSWQFRVLRCVKLTLTLPY